MVGGTGKALSAPDAGGKTTKRMTRSTDWHGGEQEDMQKEAPQKYQENVFEEFKELQEQRAKEALELVQKEAYAHLVGRRKGKERECCKDWEDRERSVTLETICPLSRARFP